MTDVTEISSAMEQSDPTAAESLLPLVHAGSRGLAASRLAHKKPGHLHKATALMPEPCLRLVRGDLNRHRDEHAHFLAAAAGAMSRLSDRAGILDREFTGEAELCRRFEAILIAHDRPAGRTGRR
jgi:hypothetical protein